ncbi:MAG: 4Fe-4S dicluster domain-containing protein, partial [Bacillota bacterium]|nr:4Fe-4S dicluster domain-containing protein [Bacillota bacterium]
QRLGSVLKQQTAVDIQKCYQCGKCSAGCPLASEMDYAPNCILRMIQSGDPELEEKVLRSLTIWLCLNCEMCYSRCPQSVDIPKVMDFLREKSLQKKMTNPGAKKIIAFHKSFLKSIKKSGRLNEIDLIMDYKSHVFDLLQDVSLAPTMLAKGKLQLIPERIKDRKKMSTIFLNTSKKNYSK